jgi:hypothetical protein
MKTGRFLNILNRGEMIDPGTRTKKDTLIYSTQSVTGETTDRMTILLITGTMWAMYCTWNTTVIKELGARLFP